MNRTLKHRRQVNASVLTFSWVTEFSWMLSQASLCLLLTTDGDSQMCALQPKRKWWHVQPELPGVLPPLANSHSPYFSLRWKVRSWSSCILGFFHWPGCSMANFQIADYFPHSRPTPPVSCQGNALSCLSHSWPACYPKPSAEVGGWWWSIWGDYWSYQRALGSHCQPPPPVNSEEGPDQVMCAVVAKKQKAPTDEWSMIWWAEQWISDSSTKFSREAHILFLEKGQPWGISKANIDAEILWTLQVHTSPEIHERYFFEYFLLKSQWKGLFHLSERNTKRTGLEEDPIIIDDSTALIQTQGTPEETV